MPIRPAAAPARATTTSSPRCASRRATVSPSAPAPRTAVRVTLLQEPCHQVDEGVGRLHRRHVGDTVHDGQPGARDGRRQVLPDRHHVRLVEVPHHHQRRPRDLRQSARRTSARAARSPSRPRPPGAPSAGRYMSKTACRSSAGASPPRSGPSTQVRTFAPGHLVQVASLPGGLLGLPIGLQLWRPVPAGAARGRPAPADPPAPARPGPGRARPPRPSRRR